MQTARGLQEPLLSACAGSTRQPGRMLTVCQLIMPNVWLSCTGSGSIVAVKVPSAAVNNPHHLWLLVYCFC
jgi:hypothetical protein